MEENKNNALKNSLIAVLALVPVVVACAWGWNYNRGGEPVSAYVAPRDSTQPYAAVPVDTTDYSDDADSVYDDAADSAAVDYDDSYDDYNSGSDYDNSSDYNNSDDYQNSYDDGSY